MPGEDVGVGAEAVGSRANETVGKQVRKPASQTKSLRVFSNLRLDTAVKYSSSRY